MRSFFKSFFASLLALVVFSLIIFFLLVAWAGALSGKAKPEVLSNSVLVINTSQLYREQEQQNPLSGFSDNDELDVPGIYDVVRLIEKAKNDSKIAGIYLIANSNLNGFASSNEIRNALLDFKQSNKFIIAHSDVLNQKAYYLSSVADKIYLNPQAYTMWLGFGVNIAFIKGTLEKLDIKPQVFYAGKFKSATEPFRTDKMTDENKMQTYAWLSDIYNHFLFSVAQSRNLDSAALREMADKALVQTADDALKSGLVDGLKYDDEVKDELKQKLKLDKFEKINFISINKYFKAGAYKKFSGDRIAVLFAEGDIVDGKGMEGTIGSEDYRQLIRKARLDKNIKAIVFRVNSGGGSALASEIIWREISLARLEKPVVVSFGDVAASGGYYIACAADSIFASPVSITGSIGVFGIIPDMEGFFKNKLGITFDGVKTSPYADNPTVTRPMTGDEAKIIQAEIERIYATFKQRVAQGRKRDTSYIETIAQGRVWSGEEALANGLVDRFGGLKEAVKSAAAMAKLTDYKVREYPEPQSLFDKIMNVPEPMNYDNVLAKELGAENYRWYQELVRIRRLTHEPQTRLPFQFSIY